MSTPQREQLLRTATQARQFPQLLQFFFPGFFQLSLAPLFVCGIGSSESSFSVLGRLGLFLLSLFG
jgi:hypothetical protein